MYLVGIDFSITSPAVTLIGPMGEVTFICFDEKNAGLDMVIKPGYRIKVCDIPAWKHEMERFENLTSFIIQNIPVPLSKTELGIENYSFAAKGRITAIAEACGILKYNWWKGSKKEAHLIAPATLKKFATGSGRADKHDMVAKFEEETGVDLFDVLGKKRGLKTIPSPISDISDSYFIAKWLVESVGFDD